MRLGLVLALPFTALRSSRDLFFLCLFTALITDAFDGRIARALAQTPELGAKLDCWADLVLSFSVPLSVWWLFPALVKRELIFFGILLESYILPMLVAVARYRRVPSYHTNLAKFAGALTGITGLLLLLGGPAWPFRITALLVLIEGLEETAITLALPRWTSNVPSLAHALRLAKQE